jgi:hypothetical protein
MKSNKTPRIALLLVMALTGMAIFAGTSAAKPKDANHNGIKDSWEKSHGLSTKKDQGNRDADSDGARNRCEYQAKTDPNVADSDGDAIVDGDEDTDGDGATNRAESNLRSNCGRANTHLQLRRATVTSYVGGVLVLTVKGGGTVTAPTGSNFKCAVKKAHDAATASKPAKKAKPVACTTADLVAGTKVHNARTKGSKFVAITLVK